MSESIPYVVEMKNITMKFPSVTANSEVNLSLKKGEILALVGENGAGKTTLMNILYGLLEPTEGEIFINGEKKVFHSALDSIESGIGMVHQHFMLIDRLTVAENIVLGAEPESKKGFINRQKAEKETQDLSDTYSFALNPRAKVSSISLSQKQKVEIAKTLYRKADILIFDEPTAILTPQEIDELGVILKNLKERGKSIIIITHKLKEVMAFSDRITVLRNGKVVTTLNTKDTNPDEITRYMVGRQVSLDRARKENLSNIPILEFRNVSYLNKLHNVSFTVYQGEILGIAGIDDNGQKEITEIASGILKPTEGEVLLKGENINNLSISKHKEKGIGFIPQDRHKAGLVLKMQMWENLLIGYQNEKRYKKGIFLRKQEALKNGKDLVSTYDIRPQNLYVNAQNFSGGNQQKIVVAREASRATSLVVADQPSRGVDVGAIELIYNIFNKECEEGKGVLVSSLELDELLSISDRIMVVSNGRVTGIVDGRNADRYEIGNLMLKEGEKL